MAGERERGRGEISLIEFWKELLMDHISSPLTLSTYIHSVRQCVLYEMVFHFKLFSVSENCS